MPSIKHSSTLPIPFSHYRNNVIKTLIHDSCFFFFLSKFEICFVRPTFEGVDSLAVLLSSVRMRHPLGGTRFRVGGRLIPVFGQTDRERERERKQWQRQIRYSRSLVTQRGYQVISLSWLGNNYRAVRSCSFFMKFRGPCENIFLPFLYTQPDVEGASARCCLVGSWNKPGFFFIPIPFFLFLSFFFYILFRLFGIVFVHSVEGYLEFRRINRRRSVFGWIFRGGGNLAVNQGWLFRTRVFSRFIFGN